MDEKVLQRKLTIELLAGADFQYRQMLQENAELERRFNEVLLVVSTEQMDIICDFFDALRGHERPDAGTGLHLYAFPGIKKSPRQ